jgi:hypothetical protein
MNISQVATQTLRSIHNQHVAQVIPCNSRRGRERSPADSAEQVRYPSSDHRRTYRYLALCCELQGQQLLLPLIRTCATHTPSLFCAYASVRAPAKRHCTVKATIQVAAIRSWSKLCALAISGHHDYQADKAATWSATWQFAQTQRPYAFRSSPARSCSRKLNQVRTMTRGGCLRLGTPLNFDGMGCKLCSMPHLSAQHALARHPVMRVLTNTAQVSSRSQSNQDHRLRHVVRLKPRP